MALKGVIAAGHRVTVEAGAEILRAGGNAVDAAIAATATACAAEPVLASLGGGFALVCDAAVGDAMLYDFFAQTPRRAAAPDGLDFYPVLADFGPTTQEFHIGLGSVATPGLARGLVALHRERGALPFDVVLAPAIAAARAGVPVTDFQGYLFSVVGPIFRATEGVRRAFAGPVGQLITAGETLRVPDLAQTLELLAREGDRPFYEGEVAAALIALCRTHGGLLDGADLADYTVIRRRPLEAWFAGAAIDTNPPPSSGGTLIAFALALATRAGMAAGRDFAGPRHLGQLAAIMAQTTKARVDEGLAGDAAAVARLLDPALVARYAAALPGRAATSRGTTHISTIDAAGNAAALSLSNGEGCGAVIDGTGIMPNNMLGEEDLNPAGFHAWRPDTRIASMMAPTVLRHADGRIGALGSGGSNRIRTAILQVIVNHLGFDRPLAAAVEDARLHLERNHLDLEPGFAEAAIDAAAAQAATHRIWPEHNLFFGGVHAAELDPARGTAAAIGDPRRGGHALVVR